MGHCFPGEFKTRIVCRVTHDDDGFELSPPELCDSEFDQSGSYALALICGQYRDRRQCGRSDIAAVDAQVEPREKNLAEHDILTLRDMLADK